MTTESKTPLRLLLTAVCGLLLLAATGCASGGAHGGVHYRVGQADQPTELSAPEQSQVDLDVQGS